jgi:hypothetical protein
MLKKTPSSFYVAPGAAGEITAIDLVKGMYLSKLPRFITSFLFFMP